MRTNRLFALAVVTALVGVVPWLADVPLVLKFFGALLTAVALVIAYLTGTVMIAERKANGCGKCETCTCIAGKGSGTTAASV